MTFDVSKLSQEVRGHYIEIGRRYSSELTLAQAEHTLLSFGVHSASLIAHGFTQQDADLLKELREQLMGASVQREGARNDKKKRTQLRHTAIDQGQALKSLALAALSGISRAMAMGQINTAPETLKLLLVTLQSVERAEERASALAEELLVLRKLLDDKLISDAVKARNYVTLQSDLEAGAEALRKASAQSRILPGTQSETELLDLYDGMIVELTRSAKRAATAAAKRLGKPSIAEAFELKHLKNNTHATPAPTPAAQ